MLGAVVAGGILGVALRELALLPFAGQATTPLLVATVAVNVAGSFLLGFVVAALGDRHPLWRAFAGTGALGGFTTYSAFAVAGAQTLAVAPLWGMLLVAGAVTLGLGAAMAGVAITRRWRSRQGNAA